MHLLLERADDRMRVLGTTPDRNRAAASVRRVSITVRPCATPDELRDAAGAITHYFARERPTEEWAERWLKNFELERMHAAVEDGTIVGGAGAFSFRVTVPGGASVPCAGVTVVGVLPTHRRRGILSSMMRAQLDDIRERGEPIATLFASEETIYGRFGYGLASLNLSVEIPKAKNAFRPGVEPVGRMRLVDAEEAAMLFPVVYDAVRAVTPGMNERSASWWEHRTLHDPPEFRGGGGPKHLAVHEVDGEPQGYVIYRLSGEWGDFGPDSAVRAIEVVAATPEATVSIWRFLLDIDWTKSANTFLMPVDHPLFLLLARPNYAMPRLGDGLVPARRRGRRPLGTGIPGRRRARPRRSRRILPLERGPLEARVRRGLTHGGWGRPGARRRRPRLDLPGRLHVPGALARRSPPGTDARGDRPCGRALPHGRRALDPRDLLDLSRSSAAAAAGSASRRSPAGCGSASRRGPAR